MIPATLETNANPVRKVGKYRILSELGRGGMANVYLAVTQGPGGIHKLVVLKALLPELAAEPGALTMFLDEARLAAQLNHANVVQTYEVGTEADRHVIVMEYLEGQALSSILRRAEASNQPLPTPMHLRVISAVLEGLHYTHELSAYNGSPLLLVHRDISPQNVFVTYGGQVKVLDFGIAKAASSSTNTATGVVKGKLAYMAPEQMIAEGVDRRADVYSLGCMLWTLATGKKLWKDTPDVHIMRRVLSGDVPTPQSVNPQCDGELNRIVMKALASDREQRYQSALELQDELEQYCEARAVPNRQKDIGQFVAGLFASTRAELKALVERQLTLAVLDGAPLPSDSGPASPVSVPTVEAPTTRSFVRGTATSKTIDATPHTRKKRRSLLISVSAVSAVVALGVWAAKTRTEAQEDSATRKGAVVAAPASSAPVAAQPEQVTVRLGAVPSTARLFLDGEALDGNPVERAFLVDGRAHLLRAESVAYLPDARAFTASRDAAIELRLEKLPPRIQAVRGTTHKPPNSKKPSARPKSPATSCAQPFFIDSDGIKKVRPGCL